jgi:hypothetical protein
MRGGLVTYKYEYFIKDLSDCPPCHCVGRNIEAFRILFESLDDHRNFIPNSVRDPRRDNSPRYREDIYGRCSGYALSFFASLECLKRRYRKYKKSFRNFDKIAGTHVAQGHIFANDGVTTIVDENGHFDLYEFEGSNIRPRFNIVGRAV